MTLPQRFLYVGCDLLIDCNINLMDCGQDFFLNEEELKMAACTAHNIVSWEFFSVSISVAVAETHVLVTM